MEVTVRMSLESRTGRDNWIGVASLLVGAYLAMAPTWVPQVTARVYDGARTLELAFLVGVASLALVRAARSAAVNAWMRIARPGRVAIVVWLGGGLFSAWMSTAPHMGIQQISMIALLVWLTLEMTALVQASDSPVQKMLPAAITAGASLVLLRFWTSFMESVSSGREYSWVSPFLDFANVRFFGQYQAYALLLVGLPLLAWRLTLAWRIVIWFVAAGFWMLQWIAASRAAWIGALVAFALIAIAMRAGRVRWLIVQGGLLLAGGVLFLAFDSLMLTGTNATPLPSQLSIAERSGESNSIRITLAKSALQLAARHPITGVGPGQFGLHYSLTDAAHPHNTPLQLLAEYGLIAGTAGIVVGVLLVIFAVKELRRRTQQEPDMITATLCAALVMGLTDSLFSGNLIMPHSQVLLCVIAGWLLGRSLQGPANAAATPVLRTALSGVAILAALVTLVLMVEYLDVIRDMPYPPQLRIPSFWQYGRFADW